MSVPYTFSGAVAPIPLNELDVNFSTGITLGSTVAHLGDTVTVLSGVTLSGATIGSLSSPLNVSYGGTGLSSVTSGSVMLGAGTSAFSLVSPGTSGNVLTSNGTSWVSQAGGGGGGGTSISNGNSNVSIATSNGNITAATAGSTALTIDTSGNLLLGTTTLATGALLTVNGSIKGVVTEGTAVASTSGTSIDFTGIPSWAKRVIVIFRGVSTNGSAAVQIQVGSGSITSSGYAGYAMRAGASNTYTASSSAFVTADAMSASDTRDGIFILTNITGNTWVMSGSFTSTAQTNDTCVVNGSIALSGALDRVRITTTNGTDTFDAGTINIQYEG